MDIFKRIFATAFIFSVLLLGWVYLLGFLKSDEPTNPLWKETLSSLHDLHRITYRQSRNTLRQATDADSDSLYTTATIMRAIAESERINCRICQQAIESLGDKVPNPSIPSVQRISTEQVIQLKIDQKRALNRKNFPLLIEQALDQDNRYVARMLTWYNSNNNQHLILLELCKADQASDLTSEQTHSDPGDTSLSSPLPHSGADLHKTSRANAYNVCPTCGYITLEEFSPYCCPHCMTSKRDFILFK